MTVYTSPYPSVPVPSTSLFTFLFGITDPAAPHLLGQSTARHFASSAAFVDGPTGSVLTRGALRELSLRVASGLFNAGIRRGETVCIFSPNTIAWPVALFGSIAGGIRCSLANAGYTPDELRWIYEDSGARVLFTHPSLLPTALAVAPRERVVVLDESFLLSGPPTQLPPFPPNPYAPPPGSSAPTDGLRTIQQLCQSAPLKEEEKFEGKLAQETAIMCYSSGTTGKGKGVETTHANLTAMMAILAPVFPRMKDGKDVFLGVLPFFHIYGLQKNISFPLSIGAPLVILPRFAPGPFCAAVEKYRVTTSLIVPPVLVALTRDPAVDKYDMSTLAIMTSGAAPCGGPLVEAVMARLAKRGAKVQINQGYGLTETSPTITLLPLSAARTKAGSVGTLLPNYEVRLVDLEGRDVPEGEEGEMWVRGVTIMKGYLNNAEATREAITPDGWFKTGDECKRDAEGFYFVVDRRKELIKYKGYQVPPAELESLLLTHPRVADAAVIGVESAEEATELPRAYIVPAPGEDEDVKTLVEDVRAWVDKRVAGHKRLRGGVRVIGEIPKSAAGKILRRELREQAKAEVKDSGLSMRAKL